MATPSRRTVPTVITYTVYEPPDAPADRLDRAESLEFVKEGFTWAAAAFAPFWLIAKRLWLPLVFYIAALALIQAAVWAFGLNQRSFFHAFSALNLIVGFEADTLQRWTFERKGWTPLGSVNGRNTEDCERRFFDAWLPSQPYVRQAALSGSSMAAQAEPVPFSGRASPVPATGPAVPSAGSRWRSAFAFGKRS